MAKSQEDNVGEKGTLPRHNIRLNDYQPLKLSNICWTPRFMFIYAYILLIGAFAVFVTIFHVQFVHILQPFSNIVGDVPAGFLIPGAIIFVISIPPLFGLEIMAITCGAAYGLYIGFAVMAAATLLGEAVTWLIFKGICRGKAQKHEQKNIEYNTLARMAREGGFWIVLLARFSLVPAHFITALFSTVDGKFWHFVVASLVTLPKQLVLVYLGCTPSQTIAMGAAGAMEKSIADTKTHQSIWAHVELDDSTIIQLAMFGGATIVTAGLVILVWHKMRKVRSVMLEEQHRRKVLDAVAPGPHPLAADSSNNNTTNNSRSNSNRSAPRPVSSSSSHYGNADDHDAREDPADGAGFTICGPFDTRNDNERQSLVLTADEAAKAKPSTSTPRIQFAPDRSSSTQHDQVESQQSYSRSKSRRPRGGLGIQTWARHHHVAATGHSPHEMTTLNYFRPKSPPPPTPIPYRLTPPPSLPTIRPSSSSLSISSFSRPRPPSRRTPSVSSSVYTCATSAAVAAGTGAGGSSLAGHAYHTRFHSEDLTAVGEAGVAVTTLSMKALPPPPPQQ